MNISKENYILNNLSKIKHKKWELYVISRIIHLLDDQEIEFSCQQYIKTSNKWYMVDICFLNLELYLEIDEAQHNQETHKIDDKIRKNEIIDATNFSENRIEVFTYDGKTLKDKKLEKLNKEIDQFIQILKSKKEDLIKKNKFIPWDFKNKYNPSLYIRKGYIDVSDNVGFLYKKDALKLFDYNGGHYQSALWRIKSIDKEVWFPKLYKNREWNNSLSDDLKTIKMKMKNNTEISKKILDYKWIVFAHYKNVLGNFVYKFLGEFHLSKFETNKKCWVFKRKKTRIYLKSI